MLGAIRMRMIQIAIVLVVGIGSASAGPREGGGGGGGHTNTGNGGRLGRVSVGIAGATATGGGNQGSRPTGPVEAQGLMACPDVQYRRSLYDGSCIRRCMEPDEFRTTDGRCVRRRIATLAPPSGPVVELEEDATTAPATGGTAKVGAYAGVQKVYESDGALAIELAVTDRWLRISGTLSRYYERQQTGDTLTLTMPGLALGLRVGARDRTRVYVEAGVAAAYTRNDPMGMDSSLNGVLAGVLGEHKLSEQTTLIGAARLMGFEHDVRALSARVGVRYRHVQASFSVLDFNVGPALYGPELGVGF